MEFRIADTFTDSLKKLDSESQKASKTTAFDLQINLSGGGLSFHKIERAKDKNFWSVRVNADIRLIVHKTASSLLLCYVDHHDKAYAWAERRKLETHPITGAAQLVEIRELVQEVPIVQYVPAKQKLIFVKLPRETLLGYGVPEDWLETIYQATEDTILELAAHLPAEAAEALLELATGNTPKAKEVANTANPFLHPDAMRRFRVMQDQEELAKALEYPWDKWMVFLHPSQHQLVERDFPGLARVAGSAGTGKTIVAVHRAAHLTRQNPEARVLLTTFSDSLAAALHGKVRRLLGSEPRLAERLEVAALDRVALRLYNRTLGKTQLAPPEWLEQRLLHHASSLGLKYSKHFLLSEWQDLVDAYQVNTWESYRDVKRLGRKIRLTEALRLQLWAVFEAVWQELEQANWLTKAQVYYRLAKHYISATKPFDHILLDESQDVSVPQLQFLAAIHGTSHNGLFFAGDLGQRIFQSPFSWKALGVEVRGRAKTLTINYRTSHQIRQQADLLLDPEIADLDGNLEERNRTISVFNSAPPSVQTFATIALEQEGIKSWLLGLPQIRPDEIGVFVRSEAQISRAKTMLEQANLPYQVLTPNGDLTTGYVCLCPMHQAKGLEFKAVAILACDDHILPLLERIETASDESDLAEVYKTERHLLYVACTRARDHLWVSGVAPASEFLADLRLL